MADSTRVKVLTTYVPIVSIDEMIGTVDPFTFPGITERHRSANLHISVNDTNAVFCSLLPEHGKKRFMLKTTSLQINEQIP